MPPRKKKTTKKKVAKKKTTKKKTPRTKAGGKSNHARGRQNKTDRRTKEQRAITFDGMVDFTAECLGRRMRKTQITANLRKYSGQDLSIFKVEEYISAARAHLRARLKISREDHESYAVAFCEAIISDYGAPYQAVMKAHDQLIDLLGLGAKYRLDRGSPIDTAQEILLFVKQATAQQTEVKKK